MSVKLSDQEQAYLNGVRAGREQERRECFEAIKKCIQYGDLGGNGCDKNAERNGITIAMNIIAERIVRKLP